MEEFEYGISGKGGGWHGITEEQLRARLQNMPAVHRLSFIANGIMLRGVDFSLFTDIVPGLKDYLSKSGIFEGYDV